MIVKTDTTFLIAAYLEYDTDTGMTTNAIPVFSELSEKRLRLRKDRSGKLDELLEMES